MTLRRTKSWGRPMDWGIKAAVWPLQTRCKQYVTKALVTWFRTIYGKGMYFALANVWRNAQNRYAVLFTKKCCNVSGFAYSIWHFYVIYMLFDTKFGRIGQHWEKFRFNNENELKYSYWPSKSQWARGTNTSPYNTKKIFDGTDTL